MTLYGAYRCRHRAEMVLVRRMGLTFETLQCK